MHHLTNKTPGRSIAPLPPPTTQSAAAATEELNSRRASAHNRSRAPPLFSAALNQTAHRRDRIQTREARLRQKVDVDVHNARLCKLVAGRRAAGASAPGENGERPSGAPSFQS